MRDDHPIQTENYPLSELIDRENSRLVRRKRTKRIALALIPIALVALWFFVLKPKPVPIEARFRTSVPTTGDIIRQVRATGNVDAVITVQVGAEVSGRIASVNADFNDSVKKGQVLARFDQTLLKAEYNQAAQAAQSAASALEQARTNRDKLLQDYTRNKELYGKKLLAQSDFDAISAQLRTAEQAITAEAAQLASLEGAAQAARTNLAHGVIYSPIDGIIITRNIDSGQTLASIFQTPVLFTVAADLRNMQVIAAVDEADIGELKVGQEATFTVNAYSDRTFHGVVTQVRNSPVIVQDVVTYGVVITVENADLALKPGMTATVRITTASSPNVLRVPSSAIRFTPPGKNTSQTPSVWMLDKDSVRQVAVVPGISDGELTQITHGAISTRDNVIEELTPEGKKAYGIVK